MNCPQTKHPDDMASDLEDLQLQTATHLRDAARLQAHKARQQARPCMLLRPPLTSKAIDNDELIFTAEYGPIYATGDTPEEAYEAFDRAWIGDV